MKQIYPASITGKGTPSPGAATSVLDHKFGSSDPFTLGVEEEYMLLDPDSFDLVQHVEAILADMSGNELEHRVTRELMQSVLEIATPVTRSAPHVERQLRTLRGYGRAVLPAAAWWREARTMTTVLP